MATKSIEMTAKQKVHTLSAKKKKTKKTFRYTLTQPFPRYWPQITEEQSHQLGELLRNCRNEHPEWFMRKKSDEENKGIYRGLRASVRKLKTGCMRLLVLSTDLKPRYIANQIILQALACNENIRILCVPNLANLTKLLFNFTCYAFVISDNILSELHSLNQWTAQVISENFPLPSVIKDHFVNRNKKIQNIAMDVTETINDLQKLANANDNNIDFDYLYLTRDKCKEQRAFVPKNGISLKPMALEIESLNKIKSDFISLDTYDSRHDEPTTMNPNHTKGLQKHLNKKKKAPLILYKESTINKIQNNPNIVKKLKNNKNKNKNKKN